MKKLLLAFILIGTVLNTEAQVFNAGIKAGLNYNSNGDLVSDITNIKIGSDGDTGFHAGVFAEMKLPLFLYLRPELVYTHTKSGYEEQGFSSSLSINKIDVPILVGIRVLKIGRVYLGPSFQYIINSDFDVDELKKVDSSDFSVGVNFGIGVELGKFGVDLRWERGLSDSEIKYIGVIDDDIIDNVTIDTRPQQFILGVYYKFK